MNVSKSIAFRGRNSSPFFWHASPPEHTNVLPKTQTLLNPKTAWVYRHAGLVSYAQRYIAVGLAADLSVSQTPATAHGTMLQACSFSLGF